MTVFERYNSFALWARIIIAIAFGMLVIGLVVSFASGIKNAIFGNPEVKRERGNVVVAQEQQKAEQNIATKTIEKVHERDVYHEKITQVVQQAQEKVNETDQGQQMDPAIDSAIAAGLCGVRDSLCRPVPAPEVQPVRQPVPPADGTR